MNKIDKTVLKETKYIAIWVAIFSLVLQAAYFVLGVWSYKVLLGNIWTGAFMVLNFMLMGITIQKAVLKDADEAKKMVRGSQTLRQFLVFVVLILGAICPIFDIWAVLIPVVFPRIAIGLKPFMKNKDEGM